VLSLAFPLRNKTSQGQIWCCSRRRLACRRFTSVLNQCRKVIGDYQDGSEKTLRAQSFWSELIEEPHTRLPWNCFPYYAGFLALLHVYHGLSGTCPWGRRWATAAVFHPSLSALLQRERSSCDQGTRPGVRRPGLLQSLMCQRSLAVLTAPNAEALGGCAGCLLPQTQLILGSLRCACCMNNCLFMLFSEIIYR